jgi:hypothetical protein
MVELLIAFIKLMNDFYEYTYMFYNLQENRRPMPFHRCRVSRAH